MHDTDAAQQLEATVAEEKQQVHCCKERVDDLASHLAGALCSTYLKLQPSKINTVMSFKLVGKAQAIHIGCLHLPLAQANSSKPSGSCCLDPK